MKLNLRLFKMIYLNNYFNAFMYLVVMVGITLSSTASSLIISLSFSMYHSCLLKFVSTCFNYEIRSQIQKE